MGHFVTMEQNPAAARTRGASLGGGRDEEHDPLPSSPSDNFGASIYLFMGEKHKDGLPGAEVTR